MLQRKGGWISDANHNLLTFFVITLEEAGFAVETVKKFTTGVNREILQATFKS